MNLTSTRRIPSFARLSAALFALAFLPLRGQDSLADLLAENGVDLSNPVSREQVSKRWRVISEKRQFDARTKAAQRGLPLRITRPNGAIQEIADFDGETPVYFTTQNVNAAISTGANLVRSSYAVDGAGVTIGLWDGGSGRASHQEFGGRLIVKDGATSIDHATHVGGTLAAAGIVSSAKGMSPAATIDSYDWNSDVAEMTSRGASAPGQAGKIYLSNHSYGYISGWNYVNNGTRVWEWYGNGTTASGFDQDFGRYNTYSRDQDALSFSAPYYLIFRSAGNERLDNPVAGQSVALSPGGATTVTFDPALHPAGDGQYRGGFESIAYDALGKNVITVGSTLDAVSGGTRSASLATVSSFSSWGPTDDGRIKPDVVANGHELYSSLNGSNTTYGIYSGTSMATPNATGSAALLIQHYGNLFPGGAMRASTLKGLLIHTADDRGNPGPDYKYGWGLVNVKAAADLISDHQANPEKQRITENQLTTSIVTRTQSFVWDGSSPIRATLSWTDPAGTATTTSDLRTPRLVNNLQLKVIAPGGAEYLPYVMPFVGNWTQASMDSAATTGVNGTDNVEQVYLSAPPAIGTYQVVVSFSGTLTNSSQNYSLLLNGAAAVEPPPPPLSIAAIAPPSALPGTVTVDLTGTGFRADTAIKLSRSGQMDLQATGEQLIGESLRCQLNLSGAAAGAWNVVATNPDLETATLPSAFTVIGAIWSQNFDGTAPTGWTTGSVWNLVNTLSHSPTTSYFAAAPDTKITAALTTAAIPIPANASNLQLGFWHRYNLQAARDGGKLEFSIDGGAWFDVTDPGSGTVFASNGYNSTIGGTGKPSERSSFEGKPAWSGNSNSFIQTLVNLTDTAKFAGKSLRIRWNLATDTGTASPGWYVDSIALIGGGDLTNQAPVITSPATGNSGETVTDPDTTVFHVVRGNAIGLSIAASDDGGEPALTYTWVLDSGSGAPVFFSNNGNNAARNSTASFEATGDYSITCSVKDPQNLTTSSTIHIRVLPTASDIRVTPGSVSLPVGAAQAFTGSLLDQFGAAMTSQPASFTWTVNGGGTINSAGLFTAANAGGPFVVTASASGFSSTSSVTVAPANATVSLTDLTAIYDGNPHPAGITTNPPGLTVELTYNSGASPTTTPPVAAGSYAVEAVISHPNYQGSASGTLVIGKAAATVTLGELAVTFDGSPKPVSVTTSPAGLPFSLTYGGSVIVPSAIGSYTVVATVTGPNHTGSASGQLVISGMVYDTWKFARFTPAQILAGDAGPAADADHDRLENLAEYALGTDPNAFTPPPAFALDPTFLTLTFERPKGITDVIYHAESSDTLGPWSPVTLEVVADHGATETLRARIARPTGGSLFLRLRFEQ